MHPVHVNDTEIPVTDIAAEAQHHPAKSPEDAWAAAAQALVIRQLLLQEANRQSLGVKTLHDERGRRLTEEDAVIEALLEREVTTPLASDEDCRRYYENNRKRFSTPEIYEAAHILFAAAPKDNDAYANAVEKALQTLVILADNPTRFSELAKSLSACSSAAQGGSLGQVSKGQTVPEFETFLFELEEGQTCPVPVKTRFGVHIIHLHRKIAGQTLPFEAVKDKIAHYLEESSLRTATLQYLRILAGQASIKGVDMFGSNSPLVQ